MATIATTDQQQRLFNFLKQLHKPARATDRAKYVPNFPGFENVFRVRLAGVSDQQCNVTLAPDAPRHGGTEPHANVVAALIKAIHALRDQREKWDVIAILLPTTWTSLRKSADGRFDLHDRIKAEVAPLGIPVQFLWENSALASQQWNSTAWRLSLALFAKAGGVPWRITPTTTIPTAYVGLHYAIRGGTTNDFVTCCSQVFDAQGGGLEFVAYNLGPADPNDTGSRRGRKNPHLTREEMRAVMTRTADLYRLRHAGAMPQRFVIHKESHWRDNEIEGVFDAWGAADNIECVSLQQTRWRAVELKGPGTTATGPEPATMAVRRGTIQQYDGHSGLLWTRGPGPVGITGKYFSPDGKSLPRPIAFTRYTGSGDLSLLAADILALTKLDWNNDSPYNQLPVTLGYAQKLAEVVSNVPELDDNVYQYRLFL
ncbi:argonaute/piwi family protein [Nocardioides caricicola]|uniref:Nuclease PIN n=1 Tax=Nocardioides caricicola TaxID=634770 RepID=A0ABW0N1X4_9ACTN